MNSLFKALRNIIFLAALVIGLMYIIAQTGRYDYAGVRATVHPIYGSADKAQKWSSGSGVMIAPRLMLTVAHGVTDQPVFVGPLRAPAKVLRVDKDKDLVLLLVAMDCPCATVAAVAPEIDERVIAIGYPMNLLVQTQVLTEGKYQGDKPDSTDMVVTAPLAQGNSGGGVFVWGGMQWALAGIVNGITAVTVSPFDSSMLPHLAYASSTSTLHGFLNGRSPIELKALKPEMIQ
jgi:hypothetical protein